MAVRVTVYGTANMKQITAARYELDRLESSANKNSRSFSGSMARMSEATGKIGSKLSGIGTSLTRNLTLPIAAAAAGLYKAAQNAAADAQAQVLLAGALRNNAGATNEAIAATEDWITAQGKALGVSDNELRPALSTLVTATKDVAKAQQLASLAMDVAAAKGIPVETASKALAKAYAGNTGALAKLVPGIDQAALKSKDFGLIAQNLASIVGGQASAAAGTMAGQMQRNKVAFDEATESLGYAFMPVMTQLSEIIRNNVIPTIEKIAAWFKKLTDEQRNTIVVTALIAAALGPLASLFGALFNGLSAAANGMVWLTKNAQLAFGGLQNLYTGLTNANAGASAFATPLMRVGGLIRTAAVNTGAFIAQLGRQIAAMTIATGKWIANTAALIANKVATLAISAASKAAAAAQWLLNAAMTANPIGLLVAAIVGLVALIVTLYNTNEKFRKAFTDGWNAITDGVSKAIDFIANGLTNFIDDLVNLGKDIAQGLADGLSSMGTAIWEALTSPITGAVDWIKDTLGIASPSKVTTEIGKNFGEGFVNGMKGQATNAANAASSLATSASNALAAGLFNVERTGVVGRLADTGMLAKAGALGIDVKQLTDAAMGDLAALEAVRQAVGAVIVANPEGINAQGQIVTPAITRTARAFDKQLLNMRKTFEAQGKKNDLIAQALGESTGNIYDTAGDAGETAAEKAAKKLAAANAKMKAVLDQTRMIMTSWASGEIVQLQVQSGEQLLKAISSQIDAKINFVNNLATLGKRGLNAGLVASLLAAGPAASAGTAASLAAMTNEQLATYSQAYTSDIKVSGAIANMQLGNRPVEQLQMQPGAIQVTIQGNADAPVIETALADAMTQLLRGLRNR